MSGTPPPAKDTKATKTVVTEKKDNIVALKTFNWSASKDAKDEVHTFLKGKAVIGLPKSLVADYKKRGFIEAVTDDEDE